MTIIPNDLWELQHAWLPHAAVACSRSVSGERTVDDAYILKRAEAWRNMRDFGASYAANPAPLQRAFPTCMPPLLFAALDCYNCDAPHHSSPYDSRLVERIRWRFREYGDVGRRVTWALPRTVERRRRVFHGLGKRRVAPSAM